MLSFICQSCRFTDSSPFTKCPRCGADMTTHDAKLFQRHFKEDDIEAFERQVAELKSRIAELEAENKALGLDVQARDEVLGVLNVHMKKGLCVYCTYENTTMCCRSYCIKGMVAFARREIEG